MLSGAASRACCSRSRCPPAWVPSFAFWKLILGDLAAGFYGEQVYNSITVGGEWSEFEIE